MDRAILALCALLLNAALAGPGRWYAHAGLTRFSRLPAKIIRDLERRLNREHRSLKEREARGAVLVIAAVIAALAAGALGGWLFRHNLHFIELILLAALLPVRQSWDRVSSLQKALAARDLPAARAALEGTVWRHHAVLDEHGVARAGVELLAVHFSAKIVGPVLWYIWFGLPGFFACKLITLMRETLPVALEPGFAKATLWAYDLMQYIPSRIAAALWIAASAILPSARIQETVPAILPGMISRPPHRLDLLCAAATLKLSLGGPGSMYGSVWIGNGVARATAFDVKRALSAFLLLNVLLFVLLGLLL